MLVSEAAEALQGLNLTAAQLRRVLAHGVRAAIAAASEMCSARTTALKCLPARPRGPDGKWAKITIPPKPFKAPHWRQDRGGGGGQRTGRRM